LEKGWRLEKEEKGVEKRVEKGVEKGMRRE